MGENAGRRSAFGQMATEKIVFFKEVVIHLFYFGSDAVSFLGSDARLRRNQTGC